MNKLRGVIFDMDGTMVDNAEFHKKAWLKFLKKHDIEISEKEYHKKLFGRTSKEIMRLVFDRELSAEELEAYSQEKEQTYRDLYKGRLRSLPGLENLLRELQLQGIKLAVATSSISKNLIFTLKELRIGKFFNVTTNSSEIANSKPNPEIFLKTARDLGLDPEECLVFEDSPSGLEAASRAGMTLVAINPSDADKAKEFTQYIFPDFKDLDYEKLLEIREKE